MNRNSLLNKLENIIPSTVSFDLYTFKTALIIDFSSNSSIPLYAPPSTNLDPIITLLGFLLRFRPYL